VVLSPPIAATMTASLSGTRSRGRWPGNAASCARAGSGAWCSSVIW